MYVSQKFATPQEFEEWLNENEHTNKEVLDEVTPDKVGEWDTKACQIAIADGKIQLKCKDGNVIAEAPLSNAVDGSTIGCPSGCLIVTGVKNQNGGIVKLWLGTTAAYDAITVKDTNNTIYVKTDDNTIATINSAIQKLTERVTDLEGRATDLENTTGTHSSEISGLETRATNLEERASAIEGVNASQEGRIESLEEDVANLPTSYPASDVHDWAKASTKPTYTADEVGAATSDHDHDDVYYKKTEMVEVARELGGIGMASWTVDSVSGLTVSVKPMRLYLLSLGRDKDDTAKETMVLHLDMVWAKGDTVYSSKSANGYYCKLECTEDEPENSIGTDYFRKTALLTVYNSSGTAMTGHIYARAI